MEKSLREELTGSIRRIVGQKKENIISCIEIEFSERSTLSNEQMTEDEGGGDVISSLE